jgi:hypothetical protein
MKLTKKQGLKTFQLLQQWKNQGVPELITSYEAFNLTNGMVGKQNDIKAVRLIDVAAKVIKEAK